MKSMDQLRDLLKHEINDLYSAEQQILDALPLMIEKAKDRRLKKALQDHMEETEIHRQRLDEVLLHLDEDDAERKRNNDFLSGLFNGPKKCKGMQGLINEGEKMMAMNMQPDVMDAAIIACAQKIEHYEISGYGTARAYAGELELDEIAEQLSFTLDEEYKADSTLSQLAVKRLNKEAVPAGARKKSKKRENSSKPPRKNKTKTDANNEGKNVRPVN